MPPKERKRKRRELARSDGSSSSKNGPSKPSQPKSSLSRSANTSRRKKEVEEPKEEASTKEIHQSSSDSSYVPKSSPCLTTSPWTTNKSPHLSPAILAAAQPFITLPDFSLGVGGHNEEEDDDEPMPSGKESESDPTLAPLIKKIKNPEQTLESDILTDFSATKGVCSWRRSKVASIAPKARFGHTVSLINNKLYVFGGGGEGEGGVGGGLFPDSIHVLLIRPNRWQTISSSGPEPCPRAHHAAVVIGDILGIWGGTGYGVDPSLYFLDTTEQTWFKIDSVNPPPVRTHHTLTWIGDGRLLLIGGEVDGELCETNYVFDFFSLTWVKLNTLPNKGLPPLSGHSALFRRGEVYVFGGRTQDGGCSRVIYCLDLGEWAWRVVEASGDLPDGLCSHTWSLVSDRAVILFGGWKPPTKKGGTAFLSLSQNRNFKRELNQRTYVFDLQTKKWKALKISVPLRSSGTGSQQELPTPTPRCDHACSIAPGGRMFLFGGRGIAQSNPPSSPSSASSESSSSSGVSQTTGDVLTMADMWFLQLRKPKKPRPVAFKKASATKVELYWTAPDDGVDSYRVESSKDDGKTWKIVYEGFAHNHLMKDLEPKTQLMFRVAAGNILGYGPPSDPASKTTPRGSPPGAIEAIVFGRIFQRQIVVRWEPPQDNGGHEIEEFILKQSDDGKEWVDAYHGQETAFKASNLVADSRYWFKVAAKNGFGVGKWSPVASVVTQPPRVLGTAKKPLTTSERDSYQQRITELLKKNEELKEKVVELEGINRRLRSSCDFSVPAKF